LVKLAEAPAAYQTTPAKDNPLSECQIVIAVKMGDSERALNNACFFVSIVFRSHGIVLANRR
jgi:hypothetical protein